MRYDFKLKNPSSNISVQYPEDFNGRKSGGTEDKSFVLSTIPKALTEAEIELANKHIKKLNEGGVKQSLVFMGVISIDRDDALLSADHAQLTEYEKANNLPSTELLPDGTQLDPYERLLRLREAEARVKYSSFLR